MVKRLFFLLLVAWFGSQNLCAQTKYYKLTRKVTNGVSSSNVSGGQFISFTKDGCYESDKEGFSVNNGSLKYKYTEGGISVYVGNCYWGSGVFKFNSDKSRLNVVASNGDVYVYAAATPPSNQTTCSLIRRSSPSSSSYPTPSWPAGGHVPPASSNPADNYNANNNSTGTSNSSAERQQSKRWHVETEWVDCSHCRGTAKCQTCNGNGWFWSGLEKLLCPNCQSDHNGKCSWCNGTGKRPKTQSEYY